MADPVAVAAVIAAIAIPAAQWAYAQANKQGKQDAESQARTKRDAEFEALKSKVAEMDKQSALDHQTVESICDRVDTFREDVDKQFGALRVDMDKQFGRLFGMLAKKDTR